MKKKTEIKGIIGYAIITWEKRNFMGSRRSPGWLMYVTRGSYLAPACAYPN